MCWDAVVQEQGQSVTCTVSMLIELEAAPSDSLSKPWRGHDRPFTGSARLGDTMKGCRVRSPRTLGRAELNHLIQSRMYIPQQYQPLALLSL